MYAGAKMNRKFLTSAKVAFLAASLSLSTTSTAENTVNASAVHALVLGSIGLPAYAKYTARAKFNEVVSGASPVKMQVELCVFDVGPEEAPIYCNSGKKPDISLGQRGWNLSYDFLNNKYTAGISVKAGVITVTAVNSDGLNGATIILNPNLEQNDGNSFVNWSVDPASTCIKYDLC